MENSPQNNANQEYVDFVSPVDPSNKTFLGKKLRISKQAKNTLKWLPSDEQRKLHNKLNKVVVEAINYNQHNSKKIYFELPFAFIKLSIDKSRPPYVGTITQADIIEKPKPLRPKPQDKSHPLNCGTRTARGIAKNIIETHYEFEKLLEPNLFSAEELVDMQVRRMREHLKFCQRSNYQNKQWADVCYGAKPGILNNGSGDEVIALSAIFGISDQTKIMSKTYFSAVSQTSVKKILHRYAVVIGTPFYDQQRKERNIEDVVKNLTFTEMKV
ncbi:hypothetical protein [Kangiella shandongensis]|uniref:hypothetical protein n=1 Tax=Kangiella shandongensis TaxID=2763258 RepID=UPI001CBB879D|nr:hypothetical protein [Kangiella shandongensis]